MKKIKDNTSINELSEIIVQAVLDEPYFKKDELIPKISSIIKGFRLIVSNTEFSKIENPSRHQKLIRAKQIRDFQLSLYKNELKNIVGEQNIKKYYDKFNEMETAWLNNLDVNT